MIALALFTLPLAAFFAWGKFNERRAKPKSFDCHAEEAIRVVIDWD